MSIRKRIATAALVAAGVGSGLAVGATAAPAPADAVNYYGALALSPSTGATGRAWDFPDLSTAVRAANNACGYSDCKVVARLNNGCGAIAKSPGYWGYGAASDLYTAQANARYNAGGGYIHDWLCTSGHL